MGERTYVFFLPPFFPMLIRLFFPTAILLQPQPPRWGLGAREVEWLAALHRGVAAVAAAPCRRALARAPLASAPPAAWGWRGGREASVIDGKGRRDNMAARGPITSRVRRVGTSPCGENENVGGGPCDSTGWAAF